MLTQWTILTGKNAQIDKQFRKRKPFEGYKHCFVGAKMNTERPANRLAFSHSKTKFLCTVRLGLLWTGILNNGWSLMMLRRSLTGSNAVKTHLRVVIYSQLPKKFHQVQFPSKERKCMRAERKSRPYFPLLSWSFLQPKIFLTTLGKEVSIPLKGCANFSFTSCFINMDKMQCCG